MILQEIDRKIKRVFDHLHKPKVSVARDAEGIDGIIWRETNNISIKTIIKTSEKNN